MIKILIVEDERPLRQLIGLILERAGYVCTTAADAAEARRILEENEFELVLSDIVMPGESGLDLIRHVVSKYPDTAAVMVTGQDDPDIAEVALEIGVYDYIIKPFEKNEVLVSVANALRRRKLDMDSRAERKHLEEIVKARTTALQESMGELEESMTGVIQAMVLTVEMRDPYTAGHQKRVADLSRVIAVKMGFSKELTAMIHIAGSLHDIGKISIPAEILVKPGSLTANEFALVKAHPRVGYDILRNIKFPGPIAQIVWQHHERMNGSGYPEGLAHDEILMEARILAVADVVEAMSSHRPYRPAQNITGALRELEQNKGILYDPRVVEACLEIISKKEFEFS